MTVRAIAVWCLLLVIAVGLGTVRVALIEPRVGEQSAHIVGSLLVTVVFAAVIWSTTPWVVPTLERALLWKVGLGWVMATIGFEFAFGRYLAGHSWDKLLADYNLLAGRLWLLVLLTVLIMPTIAGWLRRTSHG